VPAHRQASGDLDEDDAPVGVLARRWLEDRAGHGPVPARLAHQQQPEIVELMLEVQLALEHRRARDPADAAGDDPRRHALRVGVDRVEGADRTSSSDPAADAEDGERRVEIGRSAR
jgi:hypothetical protein